MIDDSISHHAHAANGWPNHEPCPQQRIAVLGGGVVGGAVTRLLNDSHRRLRESHGVDIAVTRVLVRDVRRRRDGVDATRLTSDFSDILRDCPHVIVEALGGREPALQHVGSALNRGISVVSANKTLIAHHGPELQALARRSGARLAFEASVGAAVPVLAALRQRQGDSFIALRAVVSGTCSFILSRMKETGRPLTVVLQEAIARGLAEPDPSADVTGRDSAEKLCVLAQALGFCGVTPAAVSTIGIEHISPHHVEAARERGCVVRLVAEIAAPRDGVRASVRPMFVPSTSPLAKARGAENVFVLEQKHSGRLVLHGEGAGPAPTAAAILGDVLRVVGTSARVVGHHTTERRIDPGNRRTFVRVPRAHAAARQLEAAAMEIVVRRDAIEAIVDGSFALTGDSTEAVSIDVMN